ncbi:cytochrome c [Sorangium sp. So ce296]|uniref:c-type cytochrome n=1 Tax=Sorangium sp. So ce296 TaxID=3133296 RepID=UPI003F635774
MRAGAPARPLGRALAPFALVLLAGCREKVLPEPDFERMIRQEKYGLWEPCEHFDDGRAMQHPPEGTVARGRVTGPPGYLQGVLDGAYVTEVPLTLTVDLVQRGRQRFETFCAPCHGILGDGSSRVATNMTLRPPPSLVGPEARSFPPGRIYQVIIQGYGLMPRYSDDLPDIEERWAVVAYVKALQLSRGVAAGALPPALRGRAEQELR